MEVLLDFKIGWIVLNSLFEKKNIIEQKKGRWGRNVFKIQLELYKPKF